MTEQHQTAARAPVGTGGPRGCPLCSAIGGRVLFHQRFAPISGCGIPAAYDVTVCGTCGFGYADGVPSQAELDAYYRDQSKYEHLEKDGNASATDIARLTAFANVVMGMLPDRGLRVLDVGCGNGRLLSLLRGRGFEDVTGLDPSPRCSESAQRLFGVRVAVGTLSNVTKLGLPSPYDLLIVSGVLEHVRDLHTAMERIRRLVRNDGFLCVSVPNAAEFHRFSGAPFQEFSVEHINFFSPVSLDTMMLAHGFEQVLREPFESALGPGQMEPVVVGLYRKTGAPGVENAGVDHDTEPALAKYVAESLSVEAAVLPVIDHLARSRTPIIVWGTGTFTLRLLATTRLREADIRAFIDSNPRYQGRSIRGTRILAPHEISGCSEAILVSSRVFQAEIVREIREVWRLPNSIFTFFPEEANP